MDKEFVVDVVGDGRMAWSFRGCGACRAVAVDAAAAAVVEPRTSVVVVATAAQHLLIAWLGRETDDDGEMKS